MDTVMLIVKIVFMALSAVMVVVVLMQEGKTQGLGSLSGSTLESYWGKNKGRSAEGRIVVVTRILLILFLAISALMNVGSLQ